MLSTLYSAGLYGIDGYIVTVEADAQPKLPLFELVGLPDAAVKESRERVHSALKNCGFEFPMRRITVNLAPGELRKEGPVYDLPILLSILAASGAVRKPRSNSAFLGEVSLDGQIRPISGVLPMALAAKPTGIRLNSTSGGQRRA